MSRVLFLLWIVIGVAVWNGFFDLYVSRGAREYLHLQAASELGREPEPSMTDIMDRAKRTGIVASSLWAGLVIVSGWSTVLLMARRRPRP